MAKVRLLHGKPLMVGGKVALSDDCCCTPTPPTGCPASVTFSGVEFCCACSDPSNPDDNRMLLIEDPDVGLLNGIAWNLNKEGAFGDCPDVCYNNSDIILAWANSGTASCPSSGDEFGATFPTVFVSFISGIYFF